MGHSECPACSFTTNDRTRAPHGGGSIIGMGKWEEAVPMTGGGSRAFGVACESLA